MANKSLSQTSGPLISVIIPTYNGSLYLRETIHSAMPQQQGMDEIEIIVVDDQSKDNSHEIAKSFPHPVRAFKLSENGGVANARNFGISVARGQYIALLDQDDIFLPNKLKKQVAKMLSDQNLILCHGNIAVINDTSKVIAHDTLGHDSPPPSGQVTESLFKWNHVIACTAIFRKDAFIKTGGFNRKTWGTDDYEMWLQLSTYGDFKYLDEIIAHYRWHDSNASKNDALMIHNRLTARIEFLKTNPNVTSKLDSDFIKQEITRHTKDFSYNLTKLREYDFARKTVKLATPFISFRQKISLYIIYAKTYIHQLSHYH